ncbi:MAG: Hpt domain-containing protein [Xanthomonadales bacterium]|jgi:HPt (histidine-containing phosphotransfer) domain-containing protein|nr:Hpt domain-containing protein [Xanthomonadales bacterium]
MDPLLDPDIVGDFDYLSRKQGRDVFAEMIGRLTLSWPQRLDEIQQARAAGSTQALSRALHALKGTAAALGLCQLAAGAAKAEQLAQNGVLDIDLAELSSLVERSLAAARAYRRD